MPEYYSQIGAAIGAAMAHNARLAADAAKAAPTDRPTTPRLDVLIDRACRHLTGDEGVALRNGWTELHAALADANDAMKEARETTERAHAELKYVGEVLARAGQCDCPSCEAGIEHDVHCPTPETHNHGCACTQPAPAGECGYVDGDRRCIGRPGHHNPRLVHGPWVTHTAQHAREDGHTGATGATSTTDAPGADDDANGPHAGTDGRDTYRAAFQHLLPESAWHLAGHLADAAAGLADQWTRALEQRNSRLRGELRQARAEVGQLRAKLRGALAGAGELREQRARLEAELRLARADLDHRDQTIRHLENGLRHERDIVDRVRGYLARVPAHHINSQVRADLQHRLDTRP